jgi:hypothetical protein
MKIIVNVARESFPAGEWVECEAVKFEERDDGSFDLVVTTDLARIRKSEAEMADFLARTRPAGESR